MPQQRALDPQGRRITQGDNGFSTFSPNLKVSLNQQSRANTFLTSYQVVPDAGKGYLPLAVTDAQMLALNTS